MADINDLGNASEVIEAAVDDSKPVEETREQVKSVEQLLEDGAHCLAMGKFQESCEHYSFAVEKLVEKHGELAIETVDALEAYGNALLKNAIASSAVLGADAAKDKVAADAPEASTVAVSDEAGAATPSASASASSSKRKPAKEPLTVSNINFHFGGDGDEDDEEDDGDDAGNGDEEAEEETDDLETAWEVLDTARAILSKEDSKERKLQLARVHSSMAEVATESGRPEDGVKEYETALSIQTALLEPYDRLVAQTHLFIALALELVPNNQFDSESEEAKVSEESYGKAIEHVQHAKNVLRNRELFLKGLPLASEGKGKGRESEAGAANASEVADSSKTLSEREQEEIKDIAELQVELDNKIEDLKAQIEEAHTKKGSLQEQIYQSGPSLPENVSKEVHNLNNLVKKKPKKETNGASAPASEQPPSAAEAESTAETSEPVSAVNGKRKAEDEAVSEGADKKVKTHSS